jgi:hypothetical protein
MKVQQSLQRYRPNLTWPLSHSRKLSSPLYFHYNGFYNGNEASFLSLFKLVIVSLVLISPLTFANYITRRPSPVNNAMIVLLLALMHHLTHQKVLTKHRQIFIIF